MKVFRLLLALRLAVFSAFWNCIYAQESGEDLLISDNKSENDVLIGNEIKEIEDEKEENQKSEDELKNIILESDEIENNLTINDNVEILYLENESIDLKNINKIQIDWEFVNFNLAENKDISDLWEEDLLLQTYSIFDDFDYEDFYGDNDDEIYESIPNLVITEVFRLWSNEWIEITNIWDSVFEWELILSWWKSSWKQPKIQTKILPYSSVIVWTTQDIWMNYWDVVLYSEVNSSIADKKSISLSLIYEDKVVDTFSINETDVLIYYVDNKHVRPSLHRVYNNWNREIQQTNSDNSCNISWFLANPWTVKIIWNQTPRIWNWPDSYTFCKSDLWKSDDYKLIISEVFYDWDDEWIEIFNIWEGSFYWDINLSWNIFWEWILSQTYTNIQIPGNDFLIIADSEDMFKFTNDVNIVQSNWIINKEFNILEDEHLKIDLVVESEILDNFYVHKYWVEFLEEWQESLTKINFPSWAVITRWTILDRVNIKGANWANPWVLENNTDEKFYNLFYDKEWNPMFWEKDKNEIEEYKPDCSWVDSDIITISEIFRWSKDYAPYIELDIHEDIQYEYDGLYLSWSLLEQPILLNLNERNETYDQESLQKNTKMILTTNQWNLGETWLITISYHDDLRLNKYNWELELYWVYGQSRQLLDIVKITTWEDEKSTYYWHLKRRCWDKFDTISDFSPNFNLSDLKYFSVKSTFTERVVETVKYIWWGWWCSCPSKAELCGTQILTWNVLSWDDISSSVQTWNALTWNLIDEIKNNSDINQEINKDIDIQNSIKIISLEYKTPESITLQSFLPYDVDFSKHTYYLKTSTATTKKYIDWVLSANTIDTFSKNFGFLDSWACVYLYSWDVVLDTYCYSLQNEEKTQKEDKQENIELFNPNDYQISIVNIDYDPEWSDTWKESITLYSNSSKLLDLSQVKMKINTTNKKLTWILKPDSSITLTWTFGFPNSTKDGSNVIVTIFAWDYILASYSYNPNKPKIEIPEWAVKVYSVIDWDTFRYRKEDWTLQSVRLLWVDAPESNTARYRTTECFWKEAKNYLTNLIKNQYVVLENDSNSASMDSYGRVLAYVYLNWELVNQKLIEEWYAKEYTYKTDYLKQSEFIKSQQIAEKSEKWLRSSVVCWKSIAEEPQARWIDYEKMKIKIQTITYDPEWSDNGNEEIKFNVDVSQTSWLNYLDFNDNFSLSISPRSEYSTWTTKTKKLESFWSFDLDYGITEITLKWNFQLPNNKATCVSINQWNYIFDTYCYNPTITSLDEKEILVEEISLPDVKIQSIIPNPSWSDSWKEEIDLLRTPTENFSSDLEILELEPDFSLLINNKTKKKLVWILLPNQKITIRWSFSLPNTASCVWLMYQWKQIDEFCYWKAKDWVKFNSDNTSVHEIPSEELAIVKKIKLTKQGDKLCTTYNNTIFNCKSIPNSTTEKNKKLLSMQNSYITQIQNYLKSEYSLLYYNSDLKEYFDLYSNVKKAIKSWNYTIESNWNMIPATDIASLISNKYYQDSKNYLLWQITEKFPDKISLTLKQIKDKYYHSLIKNTKLDFITLI